LRFGGTLTGMKLFLLAFWASVLMAQTQHSVTVSWTDVLNPAGTTYSVYRATGLCSGTPTFSKIASALTVKTYLDSTVIPGNYCYAATASVNGMESAQSNTAGVAVPSFPPTALTVVVQ